MTSSVVRWNGLKHFRNQHAPFTAIKIIAPARRRRGEKRVKIRLCKSQRAVQMRNTHEVSLEWTMKEFTGNSLSFSVFQSSAQMFVLRASAWCLHIRWLFFREQSWWVRYFWDHVTTSHIFRLHLLPLWNAKSYFPHMQWCSCFFPLFFSLTRSECSLKKPCYFSLSLKDGDGKNV